MKKLRGSIKLMLPYGVMRLWLEHRYSVTIDEPLLHYRSGAKIVRRILKFLLPYGLVEHYKRIHYPQRTQDDAEGGRLSSEANRKRLMELAWQVWRSRPGSVKDRIAVFSPLPPEQTGIGNFSKKLHDVDPMHWDVFCGVTGFETYARMVAEGAAKCNALPYVFYRDQLSGISEHASCLFVIGNSHFHYDAVSAAIATKGRPDRWLYLHEALIQDALMDQVRKEGLSLGEFLLKWYPERREAILRMSSSLRFESPAEYLKFCQENGMLGVRALIELSGISQLIVNNDRCLKLLKRELTAEQLNHVRIEKLFLPIESRSVESENVGVEPDYRVIGSFGAAHEFKGTNRIISAVAMLNARGVRCKLLLAGFGIDLYLKHEVPEELKKWCIIPSGTVDNDRFGRLMRGVDLAVQLRIGEHGESSGCVSELLGMGVPLLVNSGFVDKTLEPLCHVIGADPSVEEIADGICMALRCRPKGNSALLQEFSFAKASSKLKGLLSQRTSDRVRCFVDATLFDGHGITRATEFLYLAVERQFRQVEVTYLCNARNPIRSQAAHRFIMIDPDNRDAEIMSWLLAERPEFVHFPSNGRLPGDIDRIRPATKVLSTIHDVIPLRIPEVLKYPQDLAVGIREWAQFALDHSDLVFCDSQCTVDDVTELLDVRRARLKVLGFAPMLVGEPKDAGRFARNSYFLYNGGYCPRKGISNLVRNFMALRSAGRIHSDLLMTSHPNPVAVGDVELFKSGLEKGWIKELGYVSDGELISLFRSAVGMVYPSLYEGFGLPPLEAMNAGCPSIVARTSSLPEVCGDAVLWLENREDDKEFQKALLRLENDSTLRDELVRKGKRQAAKFTWDKSVKTFMDALDSVR